MSENRKDVFLLGEPMPGVDRPTLVRNLAAAFKKDVPSIEKMLRRPRSLIKEDIDEQLAAKYQAIIQKAGGQCVIVDHDELSFPEEALAPVAARKATSFSTITSGAGDAVAPPFTIAPQPSETIQSEPASVTSSPYATPAGRVVGTTTHYCYQCGTAMTVGTPVCPSCHTEQLLPAEKSKVTAGFLAFFLGGTGIHRFYLGQWWGIFYLLFWATGIPSIISAIEAFVFWFSSKESWQRRYGGIPKNNALFAILLVISLFVFVALAGIVAAIAIPAYQDYTIRAKVQGAMPLIVNTRDKVTAVIVKTNFLPSENIMAGLPESISGESVSSIRLMEGAQMEVTFAIPALRNQGNTMVWTPQLQGKNVVWSCKAGSLPDRYRAPDCRGGDRSSTNTTSHSNSLSTEFFSDDKTLSIHTPGGWRENRALNKTALIGVAKPSDELYALVFSESKVDFEESFTLTEYTALVSSALASNLKDFQRQGDIKQLQINGHAAQQMVIVGSAEGIKLAYLYTTVEDDGAFYQIATWTLRSRLESNLPILRQVAESFAVRKNP